MSEGEAVINTAVVSGYFFPKEADVYVSTTKGVLGDLAQSNRISANQLVCYTYTIPAGATAYLTVKSNNKYSRQVPFVIVG